MEDYLTESILLLGGGVGLGVDAGIFHRVTMTSMTGAWYLAITNFEAIIVGLVILEIFVLRYLLILPLDLTKWIEDGILLQTVISKTKRRRKRDVKEIEERAKLSETMLTAQRRMDQDNCFLKSLCELEHSRNSCTYELPMKVDAILTLLKRLNPKDIIQFPKLSQEKPILFLVKEAVLHGQGPHPFNSSSSACDGFYPACKLNGGEMLDQLQIYFNH